MAHVARSPREQRGGGLWIPSSSAWLVFLALLQVLLLVACEAFRSSLLKSYISCGQSRVRNTAHCWQGLMRNSPSRGSRGFESVCPAAVRRIHCHHRHPPPGQAHRGGSGPSPSLCWAISTDWVQQRVGSEGRKRASEREVSGGLFSRSLPEAPGRGLEAREGMPEAAGGGGERGKRLPRELVIHLFLDRKRSLADFNSQSC